MFNRYLISLLLFANSMSCLASNFTIDVFAAYGLVTPNSNTIEVGMDLGIKYSVFEFPLIFASVKTTTDGSYIVNTGAAGRINFFKYLSAGGRFAYSFEKPQRTSFWGIDFATNLYLADDMCFSPYMEYTKNLSTDIKTIYFGIRMHTWF